MLVDPQTLEPAAIRSACRELAPVLREQIDYDGPESASTWIGNGSNGKALEVLALAWIVGVAEELGLEVAVGEDLSALPRWFYLRNVLPRSNPARAGHSDTSQISQIEESFLAALAPKVTIRHDGRVWSIFREGLPAQEVLDFMNDVALWRDRPDLLIVEGQFEAETDGQLITSRSRYAQWPWRFTLRALDGPQPQVVDCDLPLPQDLSSTGLVEVSLNKSTDHVDAQLESYASKYGVALSQTLFFHGGSSQSTVAGLAVSATAIVDHRDGRAQLTEASREWLAACLKL